MEKTAVVTLPETCPNCDQKRAGVMWGGVAVYRCGTMTRELEGKLDTKAGPRCRKVVVRITRQLT